MRPDSLLISLAFTGMRTRLTPPRSVTSAAMCRASCREFEIESDSLRPFQKAVRKFDEMHEEFWSCLALPPSTRRQSLGELPDKLLHLQRARGVRRHSVGSLPHEGMTKELSLG